MTALASRYLDRLKEKSSFESPNRELTKLTKVRCAPACASDYADCAVEKNAQQGPDTELTKLTKPPKRTLVSLVSSPNGHSKSHFSSEPPANDTHAEPESPSKIRPTANPTPSLSPDALEIAYAYLRAVGETDPQSGHEFIEAVARAPDQLRGVYEDVVKMGLADWPDDQADQATDTGIEGTAKAICSRCTHWAPDRINPAGGLGRCTIAAPASKRPGSLWPWLDAEIHCTRFQEITP